MNQKMESAMNHRQAILLTLCLAVLATTVACFSKGIDPDTESLIVRCEDRREVGPLRELAGTLKAKPTALPARLAIAAGRIGDFELWRTLGREYAADPVVADSLAVASLFPGTGFPKEALLELLQKLPYTPRVCQALLNLASAQALQYVLDKKLYPQTVAANLWRAGQAVSDEVLREWYRLQPHQTSYSLARLRRRGIVQSADLSGASPFIRCLGVTVCEEPGRFLNDPDWRVRVSALRSVSDSAGLSALLEDESPLVAAEAGAALARLGKPLSADQIARLSPMQARLFLINQKDSPCVPAIFARGDPFRRLAAPFMPASARELILNGDLPQPVKLAYLLNHSPQEAIDTAKNLFRQEKSAPALQFLLENDRQENLTDIIAEARKLPDMASVLIDSDLIRLPIPERGRDWYRSALQKIRRYRGFTLVCRNGRIRCRFAHDQAPLTVLNFIELAEKGYYNRSTFHRVVPAFVCQGGDPTASGSGGPGYAIRCEYNELGYDDAGVVGMALAGKDTGGSQFFLTHLPTPHLDYNYTVFARLIEGISVLNRLAQEDTLLEVQLW